MMKQALMLTVVVLLSVLLAMPALAVAENEKGPAPCAQNPGPQDNQAGSKSESKGRKLHREHFQKREAAKKHRDEMLKVREQSMQSQQ